MRSKEELLAEAIQDHIVAEESIFKSNVRHCISRIAQEQCEISKHKENITREQQKLATLELTPFDPSTVLLKED